MDVNTFELLVVVLECVDTGFQFAPHGFLETLTLLRVLHQALIGIMHLLNLILKLKEHLHSCMANPQTADLVSYFMSLS